MRSSTFVINDLVNEKNDLGLRAALESTEWDAIIIQISRRVTKSATDVIDSELNALRTVMPLFKAETDKIYLFTLNSKAKPSIFTTAGGAVGYTDSGNKETYTVTFKDYTGLTLGTASVKETGTATAPVAPTRNGYTFAGWSGKDANVRLNKQKLHLL